MLNLIRKDIALQKKTLMIMLPLLLIYLTLGPSTIFVGVLFCIAINMQSFSIDEKSSIHHLLNSLPYTRKEIVSSKYISAGVFTFLIVLTIFIGNLIINREITQWEPLFIIMGIVAVFISLAFPFSYLFNSRYLLFALGALFVLYIVVVNTFIPNLNDILREVIQMVLAFDHLLLYLGILLAIVIFYTLSWMFSIRIYSRKVF